MAYSVFLLEDNCELGELLKSYLENEGYETELFNCGRQAETAIPQKPHVWVLDIMLPDINGFEVLKKIKAQTPNVPVIFISARDQTLDRVIGLEMGGDDYIAKPFLPRELVIRVKNLIEKVYSADRQKTGVVYDYDDYLINSEKRSVSENGQDIGLTSKETDLLLVFASNPGKPFSRDTLLNLVWDKNYYGSDRVVDDLVRRLRKKLPRLRIETVYGQGYRLVV